MSYSRPERTRARNEQRKVHVVRRRRGLLAAVVALLLICAAFVAAPHLIDGRIPTLNGQAPGLEPALGLEPAPSLDKARGSALRWPPQGEGAFVVGNGRPAASPRQVPAPIASLAKVMTAYLTLKRYPLSGAQDGFTITVTAAQERAEAQDESVAAVRTGEQLTERQLLEALLIPSGNNIARMLADRVAGSEARFLAEMNAEARALGMDHTIYTDPSGWDTGTVSTAADQLRVFRQAMRFPIFRQIISMARVTLPVAGVLTNTNPLVAQGYAGKTGSDSAAGGCLAFFTRVTLRGHAQTAVGVVMGQGEGSDTSDILDSAGEAAEELVDSVAPQPRRPPRRLAVPRSPLRRDGAE